MRRTDIRAICGYCGKAPSAPDTDIAKKFSALCKEGSTGNSVMYSWRNANIAYSMVDRYALLVYNDNNRCYYRLPGFSTKTYPDPDRSSTKIYVYYGSGSSTEVPISNSLPATSVVNSLPYELEFSRAPDFDEKKICAASKTVVNSTLSSIYYTMRENSQEAVDSKASQTVSLELAHDLLDEDVFSNARAFSFDDVMAEVLMEGGFGASTVIGTGTRITNTYKGVELSGNCFAISSDASGVYSLLNQWKSVSPARNVAHMELIDNDLEYAQKKIIKESESENSLASIKPIYVLKRGKYVLHYILDYADGTKKYVDAMDMSKRSTNP